jgi:hypothetical protein
MLRDSPDLSQATNNESADQCPLAAVFLGFVQSQLFPRAVSAFYRKMRNLLIGSNKRHDNISDYA